MNLLKLLEGDLKNVRIQEGHFTCTTVNKIPYTTVNKIYATRLHIFKQIITELSSKTLGYESTTFVNDDIAIITKFNPGSFTIN